MNITTSASCSIEPESLRSDSLGLPPRDSIARESCESARTGISSSLARLLSDLDISVTDDVLTVKGERKRDEKIEEADYLVQECYWGSFSRSYILPVAVDAEGASASIKDGVLTVTIPKEAKSKTRVIQVQEGK